MHADLAGLPLVVLHDHLDGGLRPATVLELADREGYPLPAADPAALGRWFVAVCTGGGLVGYGKAFAHTIALMQTPEALHRVAREAVEDLAADGVVHAELRFAPLLHTTRGLSGDAVVEAVLDGLHAGAVATGTSAGLIVSAMRHEGDARPAADLALRWRGRGVVAFDLAGPEAGWPAAMHRDAFLHAREGGLRVTVHAGEADGAASIAQALHRLGAERIGHGVRILDDAPAAGGLGPLAALVRDRQVPLEVCPTSNVQTGAAPAVAAHPLRRLRALGFEVTVNPDNRLMSGVGAADELGRVLDAFGWGRADAVSLMLAAAEAAFLEPGAKRRLVQRVRAGAEAPA